MQKVLLTALLVCWPLSAGAGTSAEIKYFPANYNEDLEMQFNDSYSLELSTDTTNSSRAPVIKVVLQCTSQGQDYYGGIEFKVRNLEDIPVQTFFGMFGPYEGEYQPGRVTGNNLDISPSWQWIYYERDNNSDPWLLSGELHHEPAMLAQISNSLKGGWLRIEVFGFIYDFDFKDETYMIDGFHAKCAVVHGN